jgi:small subunit ribosomal protein S18
MSNERKLRSGRGGSSDKLRERRSFPRDTMRKKKCSFCKEKIKVIDYKELNRLQRFVSEKGKILSSRITGTCARHQRKLAQAVKRARFMALLPYIKKG